MILVAKLAERYSIGFDTATVGGFESHIGRYILDPIFYLL